MNTKSDSKKIYSWTQKFLIFWAWLLSFFWYRLKISGVQNIQNLTGPVITASNHKSISDHFLIMAAFPRWWKSPLIPVRSIASDKLYRRWYTKIMFTLLGAYPAHKGEGIDISLVKPTRLLKDGAVVAFYPEGRVIHGEELGEFKRGVGELVRRNPEVRVVPICIWGTDNLLFKFFPKPFGKIKVSFGEPYVPNHENTPEEIVEELRGKILGLYNEARKTERVFKVKNLAERV